MSAITNFTDNCDLVNLALNSSGHGPYFMRQIGYAPGNVKFKNDVFYLRKDGTWVINFSVLTLSEDAIRENFFYSTAAEILTLMSSIGENTPQVDDQLPADKSREEISIILQTTASKVISRIRDAKGSN